MKYTRKELYPGVGLNVIETDIFKSEYLTVLFSSPLSPKSASYNSLLCNVPIRGCEKYPTLKDISIALDRLYDSGITPLSFKRGENHVSGYSLSSLDSKYAFDNEDIFSSTLDILGEIMFSPKLKDGGYYPDTVSIEKDNLISAIDAKKNDKVAYANMRCVYHMCKGEPYATPGCGEAEVVREIDPISLYAHSRKLYTTSRVEVFYVGSNAEKAENFLRQLTEVFGVKRTVKFTTACEHKVNSVKRIIEQESVTQAKLSMGFCTNKALLDGDYHKFTVFNEIFSSSPSSRLFQNVREKLSLCYYCRCTADPFKKIAIVSSGIRSEDAKKTENEILNQLNDLASGNVTQKELDLAKKTLCSSYKELCDSPASLVSWYFNRLLTESGELLISPEENASLIQSVSVDDVAKCAGDMMLDTVYLMKGSDEFGD